MRRFDDLVTLGQGKGVEYAGAKSDALIVRRVGGRPCEVGDEGLKAGGDALPSRVIFRLTDPLRQNSFKY